MIRNFAFFSTLPQSEYTLRAVSTPRMLVSIFVYCLFRVSTLSNERRDFISSRPIKLQKKVKILKFPNFTKFKNISKISYISKFSKKFQNCKIDFFFKVQNFTKISKKISKFKLKKKNSKLSKF
jgi:hypothetical protein